MKITVGIHSETDWTGVGLDNVRKQWKGIKREWKSMLDNPEKLITQVWD